jgi:hypothetical protein
VTAQASFTLRGRNPDVLTCIANLSNDEVFTPPDFANQMLDTLARAWTDSNKGANIWADPTVKFLDPCTKSGVFLREITARLTEGLKAEIPDLQKRVDHILTRQVFGIGITNLTSLLARRSIYCSKHANGKHSIAKSHLSSDGNVWFKRSEHVWQNRKCKYCGASKAIFDRPNTLETHAYALIHDSNPGLKIAEMFGGNMQFDVIIGNPPYQLNDGGVERNSAVPIYHLFVEQAKKLNPRYLSMIIPSRWFAGGRGLDEFRQSMLLDKRLRSIDDYLGASDVFPGVGLKGGVCYFLWERDNPGQCRVTTRYKDWPVSTTTRPLLENGAEIFIRFNEGVSILKKVMNTEGSSFFALPEDKRFSRFVSARKPFGLASTFKGNKSKSSGDLEIYQKGGKAYVARSKVKSGVDLIDKWKLFVGFAAPGTGNKDTYPHRIISTPFIGNPNSVSSETYLCIGPFGSKNEAESALSYLSCRLTRFLIQLHKASPNTTRKVYTFVPTQSWTKSWTDTDLYAKYGLNKAEIAFIEKVVRPMDLSGDTIRDDVVDEDADE